MNAKTMRMLKETRSVFWPWCAVTIVGALRLVDQSHSVLLGDGPLGLVHHVIEPLSFLGFFLGIPLLATLSLGNEFQHRTLPLLLSQPIDRREIWVEKTSVTIIATVSATLVFCVSWRTALQQNPAFWMEAGAWIIAMIASATLWTLVARSTLGGMVLAGGVHYFFFIPLLFRPDWVPQTITTRSIAAVLVFGYAGVMLWLGRRTLARFQVMGGLAGDDLLMAGSDVMPVAWAGWFRCRPTGVVLNLIRKELRLLRPLWLIAPLALVGWMHVSLLANKTKYGSLPVVAFATAVIPLLAVLAGTLSLGEERSTGMHSWHMTLPMSARRQWLIKLGTALFAGLVCSVLLPISVLNLFGPPSTFVDVAGGMRWALLVLLVSFASFWCVCAVSGTVRAALWLLPTMGSQLLAARFGNSVGSRAMDLVASKFDIFTSFRFTNAVANLQRFVVLATPLRVITLLLAPTLLIAVIQSYRMFREQLQDSRLSVSRKLLPLAMVAFLSTFSLMALYALVANAQQQMWTMFRETHEAIEKIQPGTAKLDATHPLQLTAEDLVKAAPLSERTQRWLRNSSIRVAADMPHSGGRYYGNSRSIRFAPDKDYLWYEAVIHLPSGSNCTLSFQAGRGNGILGGVCE
jgi:ABC-type transport system involved in multi-copper enzyme maturation permease subunit